MNFATPTSRVLVSEVELLGWIGQASPGETLTYHRGFLALDRLRFGGRLSLAESIELSRVADTALRAADRGLVHLVQQRNDRDDYSYLIVARDKRSGAMAALIDAVANRRWPPVEERELADAA